MWVVFRLFIAVIAFLARYVRRLIPRAPAGESDGTPYFQKLDRNQEENLTGFSIGVQLRVPVIFRLQAEDASDRLFKALGLANEFQTGDHEFDREVYIACDHSSLSDLLRDDEGARAALWKVFGDGFCRISADGEVLWIEKQVNREPTVTELKLLVELRNALAAIEFRSRHYSDPLVAKVVAVEALTWSVFAYAIGTSLEYVVRGEDYHVYWWHLLGPGLLAAAILFGLLLGLIVLLLRRSSRGHRILAEGAFLLTISLPVVGIQVVSDLNRHLDSSETVVISKRIRWVEQVRSGGYRYRRTDYHLLFAPGMSTASIVLPTRIRVTRDVFKQAAPGREVDFHVGRGWLGFLWYRRIVVRS